MSTVQIRSHDSGIAGHLAQHHGHLDLLLAEVRRLVDEGDLEHAREELARFADVLALHVALEEEILFPIYEERAWRSARATAAMRREHRRVEEIVEAMRAGLQRDDAARFHDGLARLETILPQHHAQEEQVLYAAIDSVLTEAERADVVRRLADRSPHHYPEERP